MTEKIVPRKASHLLPLSVDESGFIECPVCGFNHAHIADISTSAHDENWRKGYAAASITFEGECGHRWSIETVFSKGQSTLEIHIHHGGEQ